MTSIQWPAAQQMCMCSATIGLEEHALYALRDGFPIKPQDVRGDFVAINPKGRERIMEQG